LVFKSSRHCPRKFRFVWAHLPFGQFLDLGCSIHASGFFNLPSPPPSNRAWAENIRFEKRIVFPNSFFLPHYRADFFLPEPQGQGSLRPIFGSGWRFGILPAPSSPLSFGAPAQNTATAGRS
jgi:hypothetical protein